MSTTFSMLADVHVGPEKPYEGLIRKLSRHSLDYLQELVQEPALNNRHFLVQLGDLIEDSDEKRLDIENMRAAQAVLAKLNCPLINVVGNHEQVNLDGNELAELNGISRLYYSQDIGDLHCVVLFSSSTRHTDIHIDQNQREWLAHDLAQAQRPTVVFLHHPLDEQSLVGNVWFERYPDYCFVEERAAVRDILSSSARVLAVFGGHVHQNSHTVIDGIHYLTIQSLVERVAETETPSRSYAAVEIDLSALRMTVKVEGADSAFYDLPLLKPRL